MKKKIVLIDDKVSIAKVVSIYLSSEYELIYFENPIKAIEWLQKGDMPDLIISDIRMPEMRGDEFLSYMKKNELYPLAELNKRIFKSANRFVVNVVYILKDCKCTYFP